jgi:ectoine hydroxylase-related dioxygenase (phytanoyl-CoA dioxygenase family)
MIPHDLTGLGRSSLSRCGYVVLRGCLAGEVVRSLQTLSREMSGAAAAILAETQRSGETAAAHAASRASELIVVPEACDTGRVCRYEFMYGANPEFREFVDATLIPLVSGVTGEQMVPFKDKTNEKSPGGGAFGPHQDFAAYRFFAPRSHVTALISIDAAEIANGCVQFAEEYQRAAQLLPRHVGSYHRDKPLFATIAGGPGHGDIVAEAAGTFAWVPVETQCSDLVLFDSFVPHRSGANASTLPRRAMFVTLTRAAEGRHYDAYYSEKRRNYHDPKFHVATPTWRLP